jgi:hypothetical protein
VICMHHIEHIKDHPKKTLTSSETDNKEFSKDHGCFMILPSGAAHCLKATEIVDTKYSNVCYLVVSRVSQSV